MDGYIRVFITVVRYILPFLSLLLVSFCTVGILRKNKGYKVSLLTEEKEVLLDDGEYTVGGENADIVLTGLNPLHFVIGVCKKAVSVRPIFKSKVVIGKKHIIDETNTENGEIIAAGERKFAVKIKALKKHEIISNSILKAVALCSLTLIQLLVMLSLIFAFTGNSVAITAVFCLVMVVEWIYFFISGFCRAFMEIPVLFLITLGISVAAHKGSAALYKLLICFIVGALGYFVFSKVIESPLRAVKLRGFVLLAGIAIFCFNIAFGVIYNGAQNWINIGGFIFQPSEFAKAALIFISGSVIEKISSAKDISVFAAYSLFSVAVLSYLSDFGTALVYATVFLIVLSIRLCNIKFITVLLFGMLAFGIGVVLAFPYVAQRVFCFGQAWENAASSGYQQTRSMVAVASGGFFGVGGGNGKLIKIPAADTDIVFGLISEEFGLVVALCAVFCFVMFVLYAIKLLKSADNIYYGITASAAAALMLAQVALNVFGTMDMLPFTGVTLPFISNGGSSLISSMVIMAFFGVNLKKEKRSQQ